MNSKFCRVQMGIWRCGTSKMVPWLGICWLGLRAFGRWCLKGGGVFLQVIGMIVQFWMCGILERNVMEVMRGGLANLQVGSMMTRVGVSMRKMRRARGRGTMGWRVRTRVEIRVWGTMVERSWPRRPLWLSILQVWERSEIRCMISGLARDVLCLWQRQQQQLLPPQVLVLAETLISEHKAKWWKKILICTKWSRNKTLMLMLWTSFLPIQNWKWLEGLLRSKIDLVILLLMLTITTLSHKHHRLDIWEINHML